MALILAVVVVCALTVFLELATVLVLNHSLDGIVRFARMTVIIVVSFPFHYLGIFVSNTSSMVHSNIRSPAAKQTRNAMVDIDD